MRRGRRGGGGEEGETRGGRRGETRGGGGEEGEERRGRRGGDST